MSQHTPQPEPSPWVQRFLPAIPAGGTVLDLACGTGRHTLLIASQNHPVVAVDRDAGALAALSAVPGVQTVLADLEESAWPFTDRRFAGVVVTNYLHRPLFAPLLDAIEHGGVLIYETFARGNERYGRPSKPAFLLEPGELLRVTLGRMRVLAYEDLYVAEPKPALIQRVCALRE